MSVIININLPQKTDEDSYIDFSPATEEKEIMQNIRTIVSTPKGTVPLDREFGVNMDFIDAPINTVFAQLQREIIQAVRKYEPRAKIERVACEKNGESEIAVKVLFSVNNVEE